MAHSPWKSAVPVFGSPPSIKMKFDPSILSCTRFNVTAMSGSPPGGTATFRFPIHSPCQSELLRPHPRGLRSVATDIIEAMATIAPEVYLYMGLNDFEFRRLRELLGRDPSFTELGMCAVMWSEHCGYKHSRPVLKYFKRYKEAIEGDGLENAGIVDIGDGFGITMKVESHNHPSAVEPYQGAATGVGGIIRDIFTMGARPIASLNSLRFGPITEGDVNPEVLQRNRYLFEHVVAGIAGYGNCVGVPTVAGEVAFHPRYSGNPLVNAMCVGILDLKDLATAGASGEGNPVIYLGSATGKDGIHGATFASDTLSEDSQANRPNVQIGDPFAEKLLIEATLEALQTGAIVAIQDMGAAGLTCSTIEMSAKGGVGMEIDLDLVPIREADMTADEIMLSESQERMLAVAHKGREKEVLSVFHKWGLKAVVIGHVVQGENVKIRHRGVLEADIPAPLLADECPTYEIQPVVPDYYERAKSFDLDLVPHTEPGAALLRLLSSPTLASKNWVFRQYDQEVQTQSTLKPGHGDAAVLCPRGTKKGVAVKIDGNSRWVYLDPYVGGQLAVAEAARNVACVGARPAAITDGLNYGNPELGHVFWQFSESVRGIADAAEVLETPVISGNVSFYNQSELGEVLPTPLIGMMGLLEDARWRVGSCLPKSDGEVILFHVNLPSIPQQGLGASSYLAEVHGIENGVPVPPDMASEKRLCDLMVRMAAERLLLAAHDCSEGGITVCLAEMSCSNQVGIHVDLSEHSAFGFSDRADSVLFGEIPGRVIVAVTPQSSDQVLKMAEMAGITATILGSFSPNSDRIEISRNGVSILNERIAPLKAAFEGSISSIMDSLPY